MIPGVEGHAGLSYTGMKPTALVEKRWKLKGYWIKVMEKEKKEQLPVIELP